MPSAGAPLGNSSRKGPARSWRKHSAHNDGRPPTDPSVFEQMSIVYLIGAGPGHPELIAVRGVQCLRAADVVLYDNQVHPRLLRYARQDAERIAVGVTTPKPFEHEAI